jgi:hypothetical protein
MRYQFKVFGNKELGSIFEPEKEVKKYIMRSFIVFILGYILLGD